MGRSASRFSADRLGRGISISRMQRTVSTYCHNVKPGFREPSIRCRLAGLAGHGAIDILAGSQGDDPSTGRTGRELFYDVRMSRGDRTRIEVTGDAPRAGAAVVSKDGSLHLLGGTRRFTCGFGPNPECNLASTMLYFDDVRRISP
jgi:hypothetical protein